MTHLRRSVLAATAAIGLSLGLCTPAEATSLSGTDSRSVSSRVLSATSPFYQKLPTSTPKASDSSALVSSLVSQAHKYYGTAETANVGINTSKYTAPLYVATKNDPTYNVKAWNCQGKSGTWWYADLEEQLAGVHIPSDAQPDPSDDGSMSVYNRDTRELVELWQARKVSGQWQACWGGKIDDASKSIGTFPQNYGVSAGGMAFWGYTIRQQELLDGHIDHVINLAIPLTKKGSFSWPANRTDGWASGTQLSIGQMLRLPASLNIDAMKLSPVAKTIAKAAQEYGVIISDTSGSVQFAAENAIGLANPQYSAIFRGRWSTQEMAGNASLGESAFPLEKLVALPMNYMVPINSASGSDGGGATETTTPLTTNKTYSVAVKKAKPYLYWRLADTKSKAADSSGHKRKGKLVNVASSVPGAIAGNTAISTYGSDVSGGYRTAKTRPKKRFSAQIWFKTTTTSGGKLLGFENAKLAQGSRHDRSLYMTDAGRLAFGTYTTRVNAISTSASYNDGKWHMATATQGADGTKLYVDGALVASNAITSAESGKGYWRIGTGNLSNWPDQPTSSGFAGSLDEFAIYNYTLSAEKIAAQYAAAS